MYRIFCLIFFFLLSFSSFSQKLRDKVIVKNDQFTIHYSEVLQQPTYVEYKVLCTETKFSRDGLEFFTCDSVITSDHADYANNPYDKGHMAPAADFNCDKEKLRGTFTYLNCALQQENLNRGVWRFLEVYERNLAKTSSTVVQITIHFSKNSQRLPTGATIPDGFTKKIIHNGKTTVYYFPNVQPTKKSYMDYKIEK